MFSGLREGSTGSTTDEQAEDHIYACGVSSPLLGKQYEKKEEEKEKRKLDDERASTRQEAAAR